MLEQVLEAKTKENMIGQAETEELEKKVAS